MLQELKIVFHQGKQYIKDVRKVELPGIFRGRPIISSATCDEAMLAASCPAAAIKTNPITIDLGKCLFCGVCQLLAPEKIQFTKEKFLTVNRRDDLLITEKTSERLYVKRELIRPEVKKIFRRSLKLRQVSAGGDNSCEWELNACGNVNFDMGRFGIEFVASPRHADGIVITGPISQNMAYALQQTYDAVPSPKIIILAGTDAISGGIFEGSNALDRRFLSAYPIDLFIAGNPVHPLSFINGVLDFLWR